MDDDDDEVDSCSSSCSRRSGDQPESEKGSDVSGVWIVGNVKHMEDEEVSDAFSERRWLQVIGTRLHQLTDVNRRPPVPRDPIPPELLHHVPATGFKLDTDNSR